MLMEAATRKDATQTELLSDRGPIDTEYSSIHVSIVPRYYLNYAYMYAGILSIYGK